MKDAGKPKRARKTMNEEQKVDEIILKGEAFLREGKAADAITLYDAEIEKHPASARLYIARGNAFFCERNWQIGRAHV